MKKGVINKTVGGRAKNSSSPKEIVDREAETTRKFLKTVKTQTYLNIEFEETLKFDKRTQQNNIQNVNSCFTFNITNVIIFKVHKRKHHHQTKIGRSFKTV